MRFKWYLVPTSELLLAVFAFASGAVCWGQARAEVAWKESTFDGSSITVRYNGKFESAKGSISAPLQNLDVAAAEICRDCNGGPTI